MKILFVAAEYPEETSGRGGIGPYVACIAPALAVRGHEVHVLSCALEHNPGDRRENGVWVHRRRLTTVWGTTMLGCAQAATLLTLGVAVCIEARRLKIPFDVAEYPEWGAEGWLLALLNRMPTVAHLHTSLILVLRHGGFLRERRMRLGARLATCLERLSVRRASAVTSPSAILADEVAGDGWVDRSRIQVIPHPVDWPAWAETPPADQTPPVVQFIGRLDSRKAPEVLIEATNILRGETPDVVARFTGEYQKDLRSGLPILPWTGPVNLVGCCFTGHLPRAQLTNIYGSCRVFAQPSQFENFSFAALEAMAAGRAVVITSTAGLAGFVEAHRLGEVIPPGDPVALARALSRFVADPSYAGEVGERARAVVRRELDPDRMAALREQVYCGAIESFRRRR